MKKLGLILLAVSIILTCLLVSCQKKVTEKTDLTTAELETSNSDPITLVVETTTVTLPKKTDEEIAQEVINGLWFEGNERKNALEKAGYDYDAIQKIVNDKVPAAGNNASQYNYGGGLTPEKGVVYYNGHKETYYSQRVLPGPGLNIPGRHVCAEDGTIRDENNYICVAANYLSKGSLIETSLGMGKVYDTGGMVGEWIDIYTDW